MRRVAVIGLLLVVGLMAVPSALAYRGGPSSPATESVNSTAVKGILQSSSNPTAVNGFSTVEVETGMTRARQAANLVPKYRTLGTLALGVSAFTLGWQIG